MLLITAAILFTIIIIKLTPISPIWLFVILLGAVINTIASKQIKTLGTIAIVVIALYTAPLMAAGYTNLSPELQSSGEIVARIYCIALLLGAVIFNVYYKGQGDTALNSINLSLPRLAKSKLDSDEITHPPVEICRKAGNPIQRIELSGKDRYLHTLLIGSTGTGKTSAVLQPSVWQDLVSYKKRPAVRHNRSSPRRRILSHSEGLV